MEFAVVEGESFSPSCSTLVMPALSIGNVGQLAVDLLISSSRAKRVVYLDEPSVLPCGGNDAFGPDAVGDLALALEAYESASSHGLAFIQQGSPVITRNKEAKSYRNKVIKYWDSISLVYCKDHANGEAARTAAESSKVVVKAT